MYSQTVGKVAIGFSVMAHVPSPDSVRVPGGFLNDERGRYTPVPADYERDRTNLKWLMSVRRANCEHAVVGLSVLPLAAPPIAWSGKPYDDLPVWRQWFERIKSGRATFRFKGDPVEYDLDGPAPPGKLARIKANRERDTDRENRRAT